MLPNRARPRKNAPMGAQKCRICSCSRDLGRLKSYAKSNGAGGSAANNFGQDNVDENGDIDWDNMLSYVLPGASDGDETESDEEKMITPNCGQVTTCHGQVSDGFS